MQCQLRWDSTIPLDLRNAGEEWLPSLEPIPTALIWKSAPGRKFQQVLSASTALLWRALSWHRGPTFATWCVGAALCWWGPPALTQKSCFSHAASYPGFGGMVEGGTRPVSEEKPSELGTGEGAGESLELTLSPSEPEHSFASFTLKSMKKKKKYVFLGSCKNFHPFICDATACGAPALQGKAANWFRAGEAESLHPLIPPTVFCFPKWLTNKTAKRSQDSYKRQTALRDFLGLGFCFGSVWIKDTHLAEVSNSFWAGVLTLTAGSPLAVTEQMESKHLAGDTHPPDLHLKHQGGVWGDTTSHALSPIGPGWRDDEEPSPSFLHAQHSFFPALGFAQATEEKNSWISDIVYPNSDNLRVPKHIEILAKSCFFSTCSIKPLSCHKSWHLVVNSSVNLRIDAAPPHSGDLTQPSGEELDSKGIWMALVRFTKQPKKIAVMRDMKSEQCKLPKMPALNKMVLTARQN